MRRSPQEKNIPNTHPILTIHFLTTTMEMEHGGDDHRQRRRLTRATCRALSLSDLHSCAPLVCAFLSPCSLPASRVDEASTPAATTTTTVTTAAAPAATAVVKATDELAKQLTATAPTRRCRAWCTLSMHVR